MTRRIVGGTPKQDGFRMPGEFEPQEKVWMIWPERPDSWRDDGKPIQEALTNVAKAIGQLTPMNVVVSQQQFQNCRRQLPPETTVYEMSNNDAWVRDCGPSFIINDHREIRGVDWTLSAWGGLVDGLYFPWDQDDLVARKICEIEHIDSYRTDDFVLEGGLFHVDEQGTVLTAEMCLLNEGRNPQLSKEVIEQKLCDYLNVEKVLWLGDGIDPEEIDGHVDGVACFIVPGEVAYIYTEDQNGPFYGAIQDAYQCLLKMTDARGRQLKVHKLCCPVKNVAIKGFFKIDFVEGTMLREDGDICIASYTNFLITSDGVTVPQYGDESDHLALEQVQTMFPGKKVVGVSTVEVVYGSGNIHCITQQGPKR